VAQVFRDNQWIRQSFLVNSDSLESDDIIKRTFTTASLKFTDSALGGNFAINPPPQFTATADMNVKGVFSTGYGMGRYYSEAIDDNAQVIHMRFGVPQFNSLTTFFTGFYDSPAGQLARTGRSSDVFYMLGVAAGFIVSIISWKLLAVHLIGDAVRFALQKPSSKFYYLKPTMPLYWNAVTTMVNQIAVNKGIVPRIGDNDIQGFGQKELNGNYEFGSDAVMKLHEMIPEVINENGGIDVYAMSTRAQRLARKRMKIMQKKLNADGLDFDYKTKITEIMNEALTDTAPRSFLTYLKNWIITEPSKSVSQVANPGTGETSNASSSTTNDPNAPAAKNNETPNPPDENFSRNESAWGGFFEFARAELDDGGAFASFRVNSTGQINESFSNSVIESELSNKINGMSASARSTNFDFANGNISDGVIGKAVGAVISGVKDFVAGVGKGLEISGLATLNGAAFVDIPKHWHSSSASLPRANYTINLVSPYGNPISQMFNLYVPLTMLLAGALPLSTGKQSYTSPFLVELYDQGRCQTRLGMIDSISITRGTGNLGFDNAGHAMGIDVTFSVIDMSSIMHMPITQYFRFKNMMIAAGDAVGGEAGAAAMAGLTGAFDDDTVFSDYMAVLSSIGLQDQIYSYRKLKLQLTNRIQAFKSWTSPAHFASFAGDTVPGRLLSALYKGTAITK